MAPKKVRRTNPHIGRDALADAGTRVVRDAGLRARIESGKAFTASIDLLDRIARALGGRLSVEFEGVRTKAA